MIGLIRTVVALAFGSLLAVILPRAGFLAASQEMIGFAALLMAGILPAMTLTATVLRGGAISAKRAGEYGLALRAQLRFWAVLFFVAAAAAAAIVLARIFSASGVAVHLTIGAFVASEKDITRVAVATSGGLFGILVQRIYPAYIGLVSLLDLNITLAKADALANDRGLIDALNAEATKASRVPAYGDHSART